MEKSARLTIDMGSEEHSLIKIVCAQLGVSMREFVIEAALSKIEEIEDKILSDKARKILKKIESGEEKTISWKEMKKRVHWNDL
jgi:predicted DNA-binding protein